MTLTVRGCDTDAIVIPHRLMEQLQLREGEEVTPVIEGNTLRLSRVGDFLALRGALAEDEDFDRAIQLVKQEWQSWTSSASA